jgi:uncharacterized protein YqeY
VVIKINVLKKIFEISLIIKLVNMKNRLNEDLKSAMKNKETLRLNTIRLVKKYIQELETSVGHNGDATDAEVLKIINKLVKQGKDAAEQYKSAGRTDIYNEEIQQVAVLESYLPKQLNDEEISIEIDKVMAETGSNNMGVLMKELNTRLAGRADGKTISRILKTKL